MVVESDENSNHQSNQYCVEKTYKKERGLWFKTKGPFLLSPYLFYTNSPRF